MLVTRGLAISYSNVEHIITGVFALVFFSSCLRSTPIPESEIVGIAAPANESASFMEDLQPISFQLLGTPAQYRNVGYHSALWDLQLWHDRIYLAHGDWYVNTGPLKMLYYDIQTREFVHDDGFILEEHGMEIFRVYEDGLYLPGTEAMEELDNGYLYHRTMEGPWEISSPVPKGVHLWDVVLYRPYLLLIGLTREGGALWLSTDGGYSWENGPDFRARGYAMPQSGFVLGGRLYVTTVGSGCLVFDGRSWESSDCIPANVFEGTVAVQKTTLFRGVIALAPHRASPDSHLYFFDGQSRWKAGFPEPVHDVIAAGEKLFVLTGDPSGRRYIHTAENLGCRCAGDFLRLVALDFREENIPPKKDEFIRQTLGSTPHSLEFADGSFYIGLADGRLFQSSTFQP